MPQNTNSVVVVQMKQVWRTDATVTSSNPSKFFHRLREPTPGRSPSTFLSTNCELMLFYLACATYLTYAPLVLLVLILLLRIYHYYWIHCCGINTVTFKRLDFSEVCICSILKENEVAWFFCLPIPCTLIQTSISGKLAMLHLLKGVSETSIEREIN